MLKTILIKCKKSNYSYFLSSCTIEKRALAFPKFGPSALNCPTQTYPAMIRNNNLYTNY